MMNIKPFIHVLLLFLSSTLYAKDKLQLDTTIIKGNKELPQILYLVPWKDVKQSKNKERQIVLFSLFGDLFDPVNPDNMNYQPRSDEKTTK